MNDAQFLSPDMAVVSDDIMKDANLHRFSHYAMATIYEAFIYHEDALYAKRAATEIFTEIDRLEGLLSRFIENSEISKINSLKAFESTVVDPDTFSCLQDCARIYQDTKGLFDISAGKLINLWKEKRTNREIDKNQINFLIENSGMPWLQLNEEGFEVTVLNDNIELDLGGYGKGYALDMAARILEEWQIEDYLIHGGASSVRVNSKTSSHRPWPLNILNRDETIYVKNIGIGASGLEKGRHIINPYSGRPVTRRKACWVFAPTASLADALSTAFMLMSKQEIQQYCRHYPSVSAILVLDNGKEWRFNKRAED